MTRAFTGMLDDQVMKMLTNGVDFESFFDEVARSSKRALLLDYDGTLAPFSIDRDRAFPYPGVRDLLDTIVEAGHTRVVVISGRSVESLVPLLGLQKRPELWGSHGMERMDQDGNIVCADIPKEAAQGIVSEHEWMQKQGLMGHCEIKPFSLAFHVRGLDQSVAEGLIHRVLDRWSRMFRGLGLFVHEFDGGIELRPKGFHKGHAVMSILDEMGNKTAAAYLGDDNTDEDAFKSIKGRGIGILVREEFRPTAADAWLSPPEQLLQFLKCWHDAAEGKE